MTTNDPQVNRPGTPDPRPNSDESAAPTSDAARPEGGAGVTAGESDEADEPIENRFPEVEGGAQRESG